MFTVVKIILHNFRLLKKLCTIIFITFQVGTNSIESLFLYNFLYYSKPEKFSSCVLTLTRVLQSHPTDFCCSHSLNGSTACRGAERFYSSLPFLSAVIIENNLRMQVFYPRLHMISTLYNQSEVHSLKLPLWLNWL